MPKKKKQVSPVVKRPVFKVPPESLNSHFDLTRGVRMEAVHSQTTLTMRPVHKPTKEERKRLRSWQGRRNPLTTRSVYL